MKQENNNITNLLEIELLLGKHISDVEEIIGNDFENNLFSKMFYYRKNEFIKKEYFGTRYNMLTIMKTESDMVKSISIHFIKVINQEFYDLFNEKYGKPNNIQIPYNRKIESEEHIKNEKGETVEILQKGTSDLREGDFNENPLYIKWEKKDFRILAFLRHEQNISEITFSVK